MFQNAILSLALAAIVAVATLPTVVFGCSCMPTTLNATLYADHAADALHFRGRVIRDITPSGKPVDPNATAVTGGSHFMMNTGRRHYVVQVGRVFKGCTIKAGDRILMTSNMQSSMCGVTLSTAEGSNNYVFAAPVGAKLIDAATHNLLGNRTKMEHTVSVNMCGYNRDWNTVPEADKAILRAFDKKCV